MGRRLSQAKAELLKKGTVIPAHPLALTAERTLDEKRQKALTRYYLAAGAGGLAVGVHTTQFEIRDHDLFEPVLKLACDTAETEGQTEKVLFVAGICGPLEQAEREAKIAVELGYDLGLLSMGGLDELNNDELLTRAERIAEIIPLFGFYLQPAVGGRVLPYSFWRNFAEIEGVKAVKIAPFNRYQTLDVVRAVAHSSRREEIALYTGNDDNIIADLLTPFRIRDGQNVYTKRIVGGLLGQWAVWTKEAVRLLEGIRKLDGEKGQKVGELLGLNADLTAANAAIFDAANNFKGCIPGIHYILKRQGLLAGTWCLNPQETLSPGQKKRIDKICAEYPHLTDDEFVDEHLGEWLSF